MKRLLVLLGVAGVSLSAVFVRWSTAPSLILVLYRVGLAAVLLAPYVFLRRREELLVLTGREGLLCLASGAFLGLHFAAYFESLRFTSIASSVVLVDTEVLFVALADTAAGPDAVRGDLIALAGALCMAVYTMIGAVCRRKISTTVYTFLVYASAAVTVLVIALCSGLPLTGWGGTNVLTAFGMTVFCTLLGHSVFSWGLKYLPPAFISTVKLLEPVFASVWGLALFGERPGALTILGGAIIISGVALYGRVAAEET